MRFLFTFLIALCPAAPAAAAGIEVPAVYLKQQQPQPPTLSNLDPRPRDLGAAGARLGLADNLTTGSFLGHRYSLEVVTVPEGGDFAAAVRAALARTPLLILDAPKPALLAAADLPEAQAALLFNAASPDTGLRSADCRRNLLHTLPSDLMRSDALMQFALMKRWSGLAMISGSHPQDQAFAAALRQSAAKFGLKIGAEATWAYGADMRRNAAQEVPLLTQELGRHDLLLVADELQDFARYLPYNTWLPRPVAGSEGLVPAAWAPVVEQWGAAQLQSRFQDLAGRGMQARDYAAWAAMRSIGEAVTRTNSADAAVLRRFMLSEDFELAGFKGRPLSYRGWNGQLRQPVPLATPRALAAQAPLPGFLHQHSELDTLGLDAPESNCGAFQ
ncbi:ABC transporter substrate-binding protein [Leisingera daeponensis]|uniref:ABC transporter substrate-binding protein n=1 Tax=Leisingera daeponensis TaxID=405746 RepID=UPI001C9898C0|nr:ABC transporter substrate-binding protein [Leisingera daeponensis]MBY6058866.1 ABC transporter substrate-binding protein [Leisingera daeponensis]